MSLSIPEIKLVLGIAMSYDNRKMPGDANLAAWAEASSRGRWPSVEAAVEAVHEHYAASTDFLMPAHITQRIRADMRHPAPFQRPAAPPALLGGFEPRAIPAADGPAPAAGRWPSRRARRRRLDDEGRAKARAELDARRPAADGDEAAS